MNRSPASILYDSNGNPVAVLNGDQILSIQPGIIFGAVDDDGYARFIKSDNYGNLKITDVGSKPLISTYYASTPLIIGQIVGQILFSIENPAESGKIIYINRFNINGAVFAASTTPFIYSFSRSLESPTGGTLEPIVKGDSNFSNSIAVVRRSPTVIASAGFIWSGSPGAADGLLGFSPNPVVESIDQKLERRELVLNPGEAVVASASANSTSWRHWVSIQWSEV